MPISERAPRAAAHACNATLSLLSCALAGGISARKAAAKIVSQRIQETIIGWPRATHKQDIHGVLLFRARRFMRNSLEVSAGAQAVFDRSGTLRLFGVGVPYCTQNPATQDIWRLWVI